MPWIRIEGHTLHVNDLKNFSPTISTSKEVVQFINDWHSDKTEFEFQTSGSTGKPKSILISKRQMILSAQMTVEALNLKPNSNCLLCMNPAFIGGTMMIVRALVNQMNLIVIEPTSNPLGVIDDDISFAAMVPMQLANSLKQADTKTKLQNIENVIIGGGALPKSILHQIKDFNNSIFATYGMTETVSHIALSKLTGSTNDNIYTTLADVQVSLDDRDCLVITSEITNNQSIITNDRAELIGANKFRWLGRVDNIINSGGIKIQIEEVEKAIEKIFSQLTITNRSIISSLKDDLLGEKVILIIEGNMTGSQIIKIKNNLTSAMNKYQIPKDIFFVKAFKETPTGKIIRTINIEELIN